MQGLLIANLVVSSVAMSVGVAILFLMLSLRKKEPERFTKLASALFKVVMSISRDSSDNSVSKDRETKGPFSEAPETRKRAFVGEHNRRRGLNPPKNLWNRKPYQKRDEWEGLPED